MIRHDGRFLSHSKRLTELLYLCHNVKMGVLDWANPDISALPAAAAQLVQQALAGAGEQAAKHCAVASDLGEISFWAQRLQPIDGGPAHVMLHMRHWEPLDVTVARQLLRWSLSPRKKRLIVALACEPTLQQLADTLGITTGSAKMYLNRLFKELRLSSRQAVIDQLLTEARQQRGLLIA